MALKSLNYHHISSNCLDNLHDNYATQLQTLNLWHWSIFIVLHIENEAKREYYIRYYLNKNVTSHKELNDNERFVIEELSIPSTLVYEAKALRAKYDGLYENEAFLLIKAGKWNQAHLLIVDNIAPKWLIAGIFYFILHFMFLYFVFSSIFYIHIDNTHILLEYLMPLSRETQHIKNWKYGGKIYLDYIKLNEHYEILVKNVKLLFLKVIINTSSNELDLLNEIVFFI